MFLHFEQNFPKSRPTLSKYSLSENLQKLKILMLTCFVSNMTKRFRSKKLFFAHIEFSFFTLETLEVMLRYVSKHFQTFMFLHFEQNFPKSRPTLSKYSLSKNLQKLKILMLTCFVSNMTKRFRSKTLFFAHIQFSFFTLETVEVMLRYV